MATNTFNKLLNRALVSASAFHVHVGSKCLRRFMPSLGEALEISEEDAQAVGTWQDVLQGQTSSGVSRRRAIFTMGKHYASGTERYCCELKARLLAELFAVVKHLRPTLVARGEYKEGKLRPGALTWADVHQAFKDQESAPKRRRMTQENLGAHTRQHQPSPACGSRDIPQAVVPPPASSSGASSSSSSSSSSTGQHDFSPDMHIGSPVPAQHDEWFRVARRVHRLAYYTATADPVPLCRQASGTSMRGRVREQGVGPSSAFKAGKWCNI